MNTPTVVVELGDVAEVIRGISYSSKELAEEGAGRPLVNLRNVVKGGGFRADGLKYFTGSSKPQQSVQAGDLLIANTDLSKAKGVLGSPILIPEWFDATDAVFSLDLAKLAIDESRA